jgi:hypothetical protein
MPIFRRKYCIHTASGIFALCKRLHSTLVESGLQSTHLHDFTNFDIFLILILFTTDISYNFDNSVSTITTRIMPSIKHLHNVMMAD